MEDLAVSGLPDDLDDVGVDGVLRDVGCTDSDEGSVDGNGAVY